MFKHKGTLGFIAFLYVNGSPIIIGLLTYDFLAKFLKHPTSWPWILAPIFLLILYVIAWMYAWSFFKKERNMVKYKLRLYLSSIIDFYANVFSLYYFLALLVVLLPLIISFLNINIIKAIIALYYEQVLRDYITPFILSFLLVFGLMHVNNALFGKSLELISPEKIISNEIDYLLEFIRKRDAVYRDILKGNFSEKDLDIYTSELLESIENLRTSLEEWLFSYTATPYRIDLRDVFEKMLLHVLTTDNLQPIESFLKMIKEIITKKKGSKQAQIELINALRSLHKKTEENSFLRFLSEEETSSKAVVLSTIIAFLSSILTFNDIITILTQLKYNLSEIVYMSVLLILLLAIFLPLFLYVLLIYKTTIYLINTAQRYFFFRRLRRKRFRKSSKAPDLLEKESKTS